MYISSSLARASAAVPGIQACLTYASFHFFCSTLVDCIFPVFFFFFFFFYFIPPHEGSFSSLTTFSVSVLFRLFCFCYFCFFVPPPGRPHLIARFHAVSRSHPPPLSLSPERFAEPRTGSIFCFDWHRLLIVIHYSQLFIILAAVLFPFPVGRLAELPALPLRLFSPVTSVLLLNHLYLLSCLSLTLPLYTSHLSLPYTSRHWSCIHRRSTQLLRSITMISDKYVCIGFAPLVLFTG